jgi:uncharacterized protein (TIGR00251 family)
MPASKAWETCDDGVILRVRVIPRASRCAVVGVQGNFLRVRLTAPPVEGKANTQCLQILSEWLGCRPSQLEIRSGAGSREKRILLRQVSPESLRRALEEMSPL